MDDFVPCEKSQLDPCYPYDFEQTLLEIERDLLGNESFDNTMQEILKRAVTFYHAERAHIIEVDWELRIGNATYEYCAENIQSQMPNLENVDISAFPRWRTAAVEKTPIVLPNIEEIKEDEPAEYHFLKAMGVKSLLGIALHKNIPGYFVIANPHRYATYSNLMRSMSYAIAAELTERNLRNVVALKSSTYPTLESEEIMINFLGGMEIITPVGVLNERTIKSALIVKLIAYLCSMRRRNVTMFEIYEAVWQDQDTDDPSKMVRDLVYRTKKTFECICTDPIIVHTGSSYELNPIYHYKIDLDDFEKVCAAVATAKSFEGRMKLYEMAFRLFKGECLPNQNDAHWVAAKAQRYHWLFFLMVEGCLKELYQGKQYFDVYRLAQHAIGFDNSNGAAQCYLICVLARQGSKETAIRNFSKVRDCLSLEQIATVEQAIEAKD